MASLCVEERKSRAEESQGRFIATDGGDEEEELVKVLRRRRRDSSKE